jgi:pilus assembly protein Flp/PilA
MYTGVTTWWGDFKERVTDEGGATAVEYALMVALIAVVIIGAVTVLGQNARQSFQDTGTAIGG